MTDAQRRTAAKQFAADWKGKGYEKGESQSFWLTLLQKVLGVAEPEKFIVFEEQVKLDNTSFIDGHIPTTHVLIEQKSVNKDLRKPIKQSNGVSLTPFQQALNYSQGIPYSQRPRWIVTCNFAEFHIYDMELLKSEPDVIKLEDLGKEIHRLNFLVDAGDTNTKREMEVSLKAGELVGVLYDALLKQYKDPSDPGTLKSLNALCVRLVFCLYAEDAGVFGGHGMFHDYLRDVPVNGMRKALVELFRVLDQEPEKRDKYLADDNPALAAFPYVNGGLFRNEDIEIPPFTEELKTLLLAKASGDFDWSTISPTIFGAVFESTLNPETRRSGGMHYTSLENIHKVIDPLFLNDLRAELVEIKEIPVNKTRLAKLKAYQTKLARLTFLDPACGSGNFLTETYIALRRLENEVLEQIVAATKSQVEGQIILGGEGEINPIQVSIRQFYGIEINDFAVAVAKTALWIAESQMMRETEDIVHMSLDFLPLKSYTNIVERNALRIDWGDVVPKNQINYIMGNPPFVGASMMTKTQKDEAVAVFGKGKRVNSIDYVGAWYHKAAALMQGTYSRAAFVSTNSITQGEQVAPLWEKLLNQYHVHIDFAHRTFKWNSEAKEKAAVHCVIIGFSVAGSYKMKYIYTNGVASRPVKNINPYLVDAPNILVYSRSTPICDIPRMTYGNKPSDGGNLILSQEERDHIISKTPDLIAYVRRYVGSRDFINNDEVRYCLWLRDASPAVYRKNAEVMRRLRAVSELRSKSSAKPTQVLAEKPYLFFSAPQTESDYLIVPNVSSERRKYIPIGFMSKNIIASNAVQIVPDATLYHFGVLTSNVHMAWVRIVSGRLKSDYQYSGAIVYNNFPWPTPTDEQRAKIEETAQAILDARALYPDCSLADLYDPISMLQAKELVVAHQKNDWAVWEAYGRVWDIKSEDACVAELMKMYQRLTERV